MAKKLDAQTKNINSKINKLAASMQEHMSTADQLDIQQMIQEQREYMDEHLKMLMGLIQHCMNLTKKHNSHSKALWKSMSTSSEGPENKRQKHSNNEVAQAEVMEDMDTLYHNRGAQAPDPGKKKKKYKSHGNTKKWKQKQQSTLQQFLAPLEDTSDIEEPEIDQEEEPDVTTIHNNTIDNYLCASQGFPLEIIVCKEGDK
eukprot:2399178-Ditylum_brightwellii.AAC.1